VKKMIMLLFPLLLAAQSYVLKKDVLSAGGRKSTSTNYVLQGTISQTAVGRVEDTDYEGVIGFWHPPEGTPPSAPYIYVAKSGNDAVLTWNKITTDTLGNPETMYFYVIYRSTSPSFVPGPSDSVGATIQPDTTFTDTGVLDSTSSYYYLVKAVDVAGNRSKKSNMGYSGATSDRNWTSLPWHSNFATVSDITDELSPSGDPLEEINNLRDDQLYENYTYIIPIGWLGTNFSIVQGKAYEMVTDRDTTLMLVGSNNPNGLVVLNENAGAVSDRNWVSIPYNAVYNTVSDITTEYSPNGNPVTEINNLRDDQLYENYTYISPIGWLGTDFAITPGRGYEFVMTIDTTWNPTEYTNKSGKLFLSRNKTAHDRVAIRLGKFVGSDRKPVWVKKDVAITAGGIGEDTRENSTMYVRAKIPEKESIIFRDVGISHLVIARFNGGDFDNIIFTAYRINKPEDVLTENIVGSGVARRDNIGVLWFNVGNFKSPWHHGEEVLLLVEATKDGRGYFDIMRFPLDGGVDIQDIGDLSFILLPEPQIEKNSTKKTWVAVEKDNIIGYSIYQKNRCLNETIINKQTFEVSGNIVIRPVIIGGYETVYSSYQKDDNKVTKLFPVTYSLIINPNPFSTRTAIHYALTHETEVNINIYDISGRVVKTVVTGQLDSGFYTSYWSGHDNMNRKVAAGVYFVRMATPDYTSYRKVVLVH